MAKEGTKGPPASRLPFPPSAPPGMASREAPRVGDAKKRGRAGVRQPHAGNSSASS